LERLSRSNAEIEPGYTEALARRLDATCPITVLEAAEGAVLARSAGIPTSTGTTTRSTLAK
jgi:hypothetical protein